MAQKIGPEYQMGFDEVTMYLTQQRVTDEKTRLAFLQLYANAYFHRPTSIEIELKRATAKIPENVQTLAQGVLGYADQYRPAV